MHAFLGRGQAPRLRELERAAPAQPLLVACERDTALDAGAVVTVAHSVRPAKL